MELKKTHIFEDDWLAKALIYYQIIDENLYSELSQRYATEKYFFDVLVKNEYLLPQDIVDFLEGALKISFVNLEQTEFDKKAIEAIPENLCRKYLFVPFKINEKEIFIASFNPTNLDCEREIETLTGKYVKTYFAFRDQIEDKINVHYTPDKLLNSLVKNGGHQSKIRIPGEEFDANPSPVVKLVNQILIEGVEQGASDIHIEPKETSVDVRIRVDGILRNLIDVPKSSQSSLISRIKIISDLNIAESRKPQDGKAKIYIGDADIDLRVSILPTSFGEKAVIRILDKRRAAVSFDKLGIRGKNRERLEKCFSFHQGMVLVTGPTGSGKSTTLYAAINRVKSVTTNILTIEDPIEYVMEGINQVQVNEKAGVTFASALRSFLRQDPDVILVGEIRDRETAEIAVQAAQTGHLVLSTLHTNDTFGTITRLRDMGVDKFKITESVQAIIAQRLVRKLCPNCKKRVSEDKIDPKLSYMLHQLHENPQLYEAHGCQQCNFSGYRGRTGVYEILILDQKLKDNINNEKPLIELRAMARENGFRNLFEDAMNLVAEGITDYKEVLRTINEGNLDAAKDKEKPAKMEVPVEKIVETAPEETVIQKKTIPAEKKKEEEITILVVEDYKVSRMMIRKMIEKLSPWKVDEAADGIEGLQKVVEAPPDVILLDIMMPKMDGYEMLQHLKAERTTKNIPVLILTSMEGADNEVKGLELGADDYLNKPIKGDVLIARIKRVLNRNQIKVSPYPQAEEKPPEPKALVEDTPAVDATDTTEFKLI